MNDTHPLFDRHGGYRKLYSFTFATMIHLSTIKFCRNFVPWQEDTLGKTAGQMIGAARSGRQNIIEGSERSGTSKTTEMTLTDVARSSFAELLGDYEIYLGEKDIIPWSQDEPARQQFGSLMLPDFTAREDTLHEYWKYYHQVKLPFIAWLEHSDSTVVANSMLVLIQRTMSMLDSQMKHQGNEFLEKGGFRERMFKSRSEVKKEQERTERQAPDCPECGKPMRRRNARKGKNAGNRFWGCSAFPECRGVREA